MFSCLSLIKLEWHYFCQLKWTMIRKSWSRPDFVSEISRCSFCKFPLKLPLTTFLGKTPSVLTIGLRLTCFTNWRSFVDDTMQAWLSIFLFPSISSLIVMLEDYFPVVETIVASPSGVETVILSVPWGFFYWKERLPQLEVCTLFFHWAFLCNLNFWVEWWAPNWRACRKSSHWPDHSIWWLVREKTVFWKHVTQLLF